MPSFAATTTVAAPARHVWETLLNTEQWPAWDARLERVEGQLSANGRLTLQPSFTAFVSGLRAAAEQ